MTTKPKFGQNFLIDPSASSAIVEALGDISAATVLEIGPGKGAITRLLATRAHRLIAVELDPTLAEQLRRQCPKIEVLPNRTSWITDFPNCHDSRREVSSRRQPALLHHFANPAPPLRPPSGHRPRGPHGATRSRRPRFRPARHPRLRPAHRDHPDLCPGSTISSPLPPAAFCTATGCLFHGGTPDLRTPLSAIGSRPLPDDFVSFLKQSTSPRSRKTLANNLRFAGFPPVDIANALAEAKRFRKGIPLRSPPT